MFDIGFWELAIIGIVALLVVGPERLPGLIRTVGYWLGKIKEMAGSVKSDLRQELDKVEDLQEKLREQEEILNRHNILSKDSLSISTKSEAQVQPVVEQIKSADPLLPDEKRSSIEDDVVVQQKNSVNEKTG